MEAIEINGKIFTVQEVVCNNKNATARLRDNTIIISLPSRWPVHEREKIKSNLRKRAIRSIENGRWNVDIGKRLEFEDGETIIVLGNEFQMCFIESRRSRVRITGRKVEVYAGDNTDKNTTSKLVMKKISEVVMPELMDKINTLNQKYFQSKISSVKIKDSVSRWGSCSTHGGITLNFRLLLMPSDILEYVIVHELAHTKYLSHGPRFWGLVEKIIPDHKEKRRWLKKNGWKANLTKAEPLEEPY
ncbi:MAG: SprT family zinc-dependent metalloprotease [Candidatus Micrarchaeota archaeon]